jgi:glyoxylase-like metal-dependent hydrolase (beta-lactamase superfamily II)
LTGELRSTGHESESHRVTAFVGANRWKTNVYLVTAKLSGRSFLIDAGGETAQLLPALRDVNPAIEFVLLTHGHFDHMTCAAALCEAFSAPCVVHPGDARLLRQSPFYALRFDGAPVSLPGAVLTLDAPNLPDLAASGIRVIDTPGHTPGGVCYAVGSFFFTGDTLFREAIGRTDQPGGDRGGLARSVDHLLATMPERGIILPGHGKPWDAAAARAWWQGAAGAPPALDRFL